ncbi:MAG: PEP-CTERM sorting domain-containing protein [Verrucomicrobiales bacterium]|nr:PEP-CTERM sorting domain-containing protein [Verrucomicrobiales bacterium]
MAFSPTGSRPEIASKAIVFNAGPVPAILLPLLLASIWMSRRRKQQLDLEAAKTQILPG